jgi:signal peptidase I
MDVAMVLFIALVVTGSVVLYDRLVRRPRIASGPSVPSGDQKDPWLIEYSKAFFPVILLVFVLRSFIVEPFRIPSGSMLPSLHVGDFILVNKFGYGIRIPVINQKVLEIDSPERGDVMVFRFPHDKTINFIKRVIGLPGDKVDYRDKKLFINGVEVPRSDVTEYPFQESGRRHVVAKRFVEALGDNKHHILVDPGKKTTSMSFSVPPGHYFVMGDNRDYSNDSRYWGFVPEANVIGKAFFIWFSWDVANGGGVDWGRIGNSIE